MRVCLKALLSAIAIIQRCLRQAIGCFMGNNRWILVLVLLAVPLLVGGQCAFFFSSGGGSSDRDEDDDKKGLTIIASNGRLKIYTGLPNNT